MICAQTYCVSDLTYNPVKKNRNKDIPLNQYRFRFQLETDIMPVEKFFMAPDSEKALEMFAYSCKRLETQPEIIEFAEWNRWSEKWNSLSIPSASEETSLAATDETVRRSKNGDEREKRKKAPGDRLFLKDPANWNKERSDGSWILTREVIEKGIQDGTIGKDARVWEGPNTAEQARKEGFTGAWEDIETHFPPPKKTITPVPR